MSIWLISANGMGEGIIEIIEQMLGMENEICVSFNNHSTYITSFDAPAHGGGSIKWQWLRQNEIKHIIDGTIFMMLIFNYFYF